LGPLLTSLSAHNSIASYVKTWFYYETWSQWCQISFPFLFDSMLFPHFQSTLSCHRNVWASLSASLRVWPLIVCSLILTWILFIT
jgi:hypothetical protein